MEHNIKCYKNNKLVLKVKCYMATEVFLKQLHNGVLYYDTDFDKGNFEMINLRNFDKVVVENELYFNAMREI